MLHTHDDFLSAIATDPADRALRLVYADWLDEQSDPRGELVRVEEEMRELPVFADRFWALKPRRDELRVQAGAEWCGRMRYGTECEPVFRHGIPDGWRERWRLIREFTERWHRVPMPDVGGRQAEIAEAESRLGRKLPPSVCEFLAYENDWFSDIRPNGWQMSQVPGHAAVSLDEIDGRIWDSDGVRYADFGRPDPPVYRYTDSHGESASPVSESLTADFFRAVWKNLCAAGGGFVTTIEQATTLLHDLDCAYPSRAILGGDRFYEADNITIWLTDRPGRTDQVILSVEVFKPLARPQVPDFLWDNARKSSRPRGIFASPQS